MNIVSAVILCTIVGAVGAIVLVAAAKFMAVEEDPRIEEVSACLAGANCGGCGYAGCSDYAKAVVLDGGPAPVSRAALAGAIGRKLLALCPGFACLDEYRARCFVPGHWVTVCTGTETYAAQALSIDDAGRLVVQREGGRTEALRCGEVTIRPTKTD